jgi:hypothetical protein
MTDPRWRRISKPMAAAAHRPWIRRAWAGLWAWMVFSAILHGSPWLGGPPIQLDLWFGTLLTSQPIAARLFGLAVQGLMILALVYGYERFLNAPQRPWFVSGAMAGALFWLLLVGVVLPLLDLINPLIQAAILPSVGLFALRQGLFPAALWLLASLGLGLTLAAYAR